MSRLHDDLKQRVMEIVTDAVERLSGEEAATLLEELVDAVQEKLDEVVDLMNEQEEEASDE